MCKTLPFIFVVALAGCGKSTDPIVFGHLDPKNGSDCEYKALKSAVDKTNADPAERPHGRRVHMIHAGIDGMNAEQVQGQAVRLAAVNKVFAVIGGETAEQAERIGKAAQGDSIPAFTLSGWNGSPSNSWLVPVGIAPSDQGRCLGKYVHSNLGPRQVVILIDESSQFHRVVAESFEEELKGATITRLHLPQRGLEAHLARLEEERVLQRFGKANPALLALCMSASDALDWEARIKKEHKYDRPVVFGGDEGAVAQVSSVPSQTENWIVASAFSAADMPVERGTKFVNDYKEKHGQAPTATAALAVDAYSVLLQALKRAPDATAAKVLDELRKKDASFDVLSGKLKFSQDLTPRRAVFVGQIIQGAFQKRKLFEPDSEVAPTQ